MTLAQMRLRVAEYLTILDDDQATIKDGVVTSTGITNRINEIYREELFQLLSSRFPEDFTQDTTPSSTYTATGTAHASTSGTTLVATTSIFDNSMVGVTIQNPTDSLTSKVIAYTSGTTVTMDSDVTAWVGDAFYVLGNEFTFGGDTTDIKEIIQFRLKFRGSDSVFQVAEPRNFRDAVRWGGESFSPLSPMWYRTTVNVNGVGTPAVGILPAPTDYTGLFEFSYTQRPAVLTDTDEPRINTAGISGCLINGTTAWGHTLMGRLDLADRYLGLYEKGKKDLIANYRPRNRAGASKVRQGAFMTSLGRRYV